MRRRWTGGSPPGSVRCADGAAAYVTSAVKARAEHRRVVVPTVTPAAVKATPALTNKRREGGLGRGGSTLIPGGSRPSSTAVAATWRRATYSPTSQWWVHVRCSCGDALRIGDILSRAAQAESMPRFRRLT